MAICDTLLWQGFASVVIPGVTINRVCAMSKWLLNRSNAFPPALRSWVVIGVGLGTIPMIISPINRLVLRVVMCTEFLYDVDCFTCYTSILHNNSHCKSHDHGDIICLSKVPHRFVGYNNVEKTLRADFKTMSFDSADRTIKY